MNKKTFIFSHNIGLLTLFIIFYYENCVCIPIVKMNIFDCRKRYLRKRDKSRQYDQ